MRIINQGNDTSPINCAIYARVSTDHGLKQEFNSIDAQIESCQHYVAMNKMHGWQQSPEHVFTDEALSGGNTERPALQKMLRLIRSKKIQVVLIYKIDRLSRNLRDFIEMQELFTKHGCSLVSTTESFDTSTAMGRAMLNLVGVFAQLERERIRERITDKIAATKARGLWVGGVPPFGYEIKEKKLTINPQHASIVRLIYELRAQGIFPQAIASQLRERKLTYTSTRGGEKDWSTRKVSSVLLCPTYAGYTVHKEKLYEGQHEAIVPRELWQQVRELIEQNPMSHAKPRQAHDDFPLRGLMTCAHCGKKFTTTFTSRNGVRHRYYICSTRNREGREMCDSPILSAQAVEQHLCQELTDICHDQELHDILRHIMPRYKAELISDSLYNIDILMDYLTPPQLRELFDSVYEHIEYSHEQSAFLLTKRTFNQ